MLIVSCGLGSAEFVDWAVTALFYAALHWLRAFLAQEGVQIGSYAAEDQAFQQVLVLRQSPEPFGWYKTLKAESRAARYEMKSYSSADFRDLEQNYYDPFKRFILSHLQP